METKAFDNICKILSEMSITDFDLFSKRKVVKNEFYFNMLMPATSTRELYNELIIPFYEELNDNHKISFVKQTETITTYLKKLSEINLLFKKNKEAKLFFQNLYEPKSKEYNWIILAHYIYVSIINEMQFYCLKNNLDFESICESANFKNPPFYFHSSLFSDFKETQNKEKESDESDLLVQKHDNIFSNNGFEFFEYLLEKNHIPNKNSYGRVASISFFYRVMLEDKYIHAPVEEFKTWFNKKYNDSITKIQVKTTVADDNRIDIYEKTKVWFTSKTITYRK